MSPQGRGLDAQRLHPLVGMGVSCMRKRCKLFFCGAVSLLITAVMAHAIFNTLIRTHYRWIACVAVFLMYVPQRIRAPRRFMHRKQAERQG